MSITTQLLTQIIELARRKGLRQKDLAERAGLSAESLSRAKKAGDMHLSSLQKLAGIVGLQLCLGPDEPIMHKINSASLFK
ncbi:MAG TPA: hypothetical protein ENJ08_03810 [Gammaproteobacteria bacterium]|nr:hypothetical protein [Gammaproteobacteria bacterium]